MRITTPLNFDWYFAKKQNNLTLNDMTMVNIPHSNVTVDLNHVDSQVYQFESIYKKQLNITKKNNKRYFIEFDGVLHKVCVFVNDKLVGKHLGGFTAFKFDITDALNDKENWLTVEVDSRESLDVPPFGNVVDFLTYGGIYREVRLIETENHYIEDVRIHTKDLLIEPKIEVEITTNGGEHVEVTLCDKDQVLKTSSASVGSLVQLNFPVTLWDIDQPKLYQLKITLDGKDEVIMKTGFREAIFKQDGFYLNGKKIKINGLNRHQIYPHVGFAMPKSAQVMDAKILKETGNAVRTSHYPQSQHFIDACDELGLLVFTEAPGWQHIGGDLWQVSFKEQVKEMVRQYRHHPSIILWGVRVNESADNHELYEQTNQISHVLDDKQTGGVRCFAFSEELEDVYTYNDFIHNGSNVLLKPINEVYGQKRPYLITEFNGHMFPTKSFDTSARRLEHALRYAKIINAYNGDDRISGAFGWQFIDYNTHQEFGSSDRMCYHGVYDIFRMPKEAAHVYRSQVANKPYLEVLNSMDIGDYDQSYIDQMVVASNCEYIDLYQNERYVGKFYPNDKDYPHLKHPLYTIDDFYGDAYQKDLGIKKADAKKYIELAHLVAKRGGMDKVLKEDHLNLEDLDIGWQMYGKYVANWGSGVFTYRLIGHYKDQIIEKNIGPYYNYSYDVKADTNELIIGDTYDVTRISISAIDDLKQLKSYCFDSFMIETQGDITLIGPNHIGLIGGKYAFWIKSVKKGQGTVRIRNHRFDETLTFHIK